MGVIWLGVVVSICCSISGLCGAVVQDEHLAVQCGTENMQVVISRPVDDASKLKILHTHGKMNVLRTDASCSLWVTQKPDGSVIIGTAYEGCYVKQMDRDYVLTLGFSTKQDGKNVIVKKELKCSGDSYQDAPSPDQCAAVPINDRLECANPQGSQDACINEGCCYDPLDQNTPCYYGSTVTARCTQEGLFLIAIPSSLTAPRLDLNSIQLLGSGAECNAVARNNEFLLYEFPLSSCGTEMKVVGDQAVYENEMQATKTIQMWNGISITRDTTFRLQISCSFAVTGFLPLKVDVVTLSPPPPVSSEGPIAFEMRLAVDSQYSNYYADQDYPVVKVLRDPVFAEVRIIHKNDSQLVLVLHQCWATPTTDPFDENQWPILFNGCPYTGDNYLSELIPVNRSSNVLFPNLYSRFNLKTFVFVDEITYKALSGQVYIHCSASVCIPSPAETCTTTCSRRKRSSALLDDRGTVLVSSDIPIYFETSLHKAEKKEVHGVVRLPQPRDQINFALVVLGILGVLLLTVTTWAFNRQRKSRSLLIKSPSVEKAMHIMTVSGQVVM